MDPIGDMATRIRNASAVGKATATVLASKIVQAILDMLVRDGWIAETSRSGKKTRKNIEISLKYDNGQAAITGIRRISKPGRRVYRGWKELKSVRGGYGAMVLSTPQGVMTDREARKAQVGGEVMLEIW